EADVAVLGFRAEVAVELVASEDGPGEVRVIAAVYKANEPDTARLCLGVAEACADVRSGPRRRLWRRRERRLGPGRCGSRGEREEGEQVLLHGLSLCDGEER